MQDKDSTGFPGRRKLLPYLQKQQLNGYNYSVKASGTAARSDLLRDRCQCLEPVLATRDSLSSVLSSERSGNFEIRLLNPSRTTILAYREVAFRYRTTATVPPCSPLLRWQGCPSTLLTAVLRTIPPLDTCAPSEYQSFPPGRTRSLLGSVVVSPVCAAVAVTVGEQNWSSSSTDVRHR